jgi:hypothetical protein
MNYAWICSVVYSNIVQIREILFCILLVYSADVDMFGCIFKYSDYDTKKGEFDYSIGDLCLQGQFPFPQIRFNFLSDILMT